MDESFEIKLAQSALEDLRDMLVWYAGQEADEAGQRLARRILERIEDLVGHLRMGRVVPEFGEESLRELIEPPFRVVYRIAPSSTVTVIRIWRSERLLKLPESSPE